MIKNYQAIIETIEEIESSLSKLQHFFKTVKELIRSNETVIKFNEKNYNTLSGYRIVFENHIMWESRKEYFKIINNFLNGKIDGKDFRKLFNRLRYNNMQELSQVEKNLQHKIDFQLTSESINFSDLIEDLFNLVETFDPNLNDMELKELNFSENELKLESVPLCINENELRSVIKTTILPKFLKYYDPN